MECYHTLSLAWTLMGFNPINSRLWIIVEASLNLSPIFSIRRYREWNLSFSCICFKNWASNCIPSVVSSIIDRTIQLTPRYHVISETSTFNNDIFFIRSVIGSTSWINFIYWENCECEVVVVIVVTVESYLNTHFITLAPATNWLAHDIGFIYVHCGYCLGRHVQVERSELAVEFWRFIHSWEVWLAWDVDGCSSWFFTTCGCNSI